jgi:hypothetical protein
MAQKTITLHLTPDGWMADMAEADPSIAERFGTTLIPTAFTCRAPAQRVIAELSQSNPGCRVVVAEFPRGWDKV